MKMRYHSMKWFFKCARCIKVCPMVSLSFNVSIQPKNFIPLKEWAFLLMDSSIWALSHVLMETVIEDHTPWWWMEGRLKVISSLNFYLKIQHRMKLMFLAVRYSLHRLKMDSWVVRVSSGYKMGAYSLASISVTGWVKGSFITWILLMKQQTYIMLSTTGMKI